MKIRKNILFGFFWMVSIFMYGYFKPLLIAVYSFLSIRTRFYIQQFDITYLILFIYFLISVPIVLFSTDLNAMTNLASLFLAFIFYFSLQSNATNFCKPIIYLGIFASIDAIYQFYAGEDIFGIPLYADFRSTGPFTWSSPVIGSFLTILFFSVNDFIRNKKISFAIQAIFLLAILLSGNRSNFLQILFIFLFLSSLKIQTFWIIFISILYFYRIEVLELVGFEAIARIANLFTIDSVIQLEMQEGRRLHMWSYLYQNIPIQYFFLGTGLGMSEILISNTYPFGNYLHPHFLYLEIFLNLGLFFFLVFLAVLFRAFSKLDRTGKAIFLTFWGPFNILHSFLDLFWLSMLVLNLLLVAAHQEIASKKTNT